MRITASTKPSEVIRSWYMLDLAKHDTSLGRLASEVAKVLRGKHKPQFTQHVDAGDYVVVVNTKQVSVTGNKRQGKIYYRHTGYPGGIRGATLEEMLEKKPNEVFKLAVKRMLPRGPLGAQMLKKLKLFSDGNHPHQAQKLQDFPYVPKREEE